MSNPYTPDFDQIPPVLAGREEALSKIDEVVEKTASGRSLEVIVSGPPGYGKTTLLRRTAERLEGDPRIEAVMVDSLKVRTCDQLHCLLLGESPKEGDAASLSHFQAVWDRSWRCEALLTHRPTFLMVDDADQVTEELVHGILSLCLKAKFEKVKFGFILAGSPWLMQHLFDLHADDLERSYGWIDLELLEPEAVTTALLQPLEDAGHRIQLEEEDLEYLVAQTRCYPFFIQCVGHSLWDAAEATGRKVVDSGVVDSARPEWWRRINAMLADRMRQLEERGLLPYARALAWYFRSGQKYISLDDFDRVIEMRDADADAKRIWGELETLGYVRTDERHGGRIEPGVPILMDYVLKAMVFEGKSIAGQSTARP